MYSLRTITPPTVEPVSLYTFKDHLRLDGDDENTILSLYLRAARNHAEKITRRAFLPQVVEFGLDRFPYGGSDRNRSHIYTPSSSVPDWIDRFTIRLPRPACLQVQSVTYRDMLGVTQTMDPASYVLDTAGEPSRLAPVNNSFWPVGSLYQAGGVRITYLAGSFAQLVAETLEVSATSNVTLTQPVAGGPMSFSQVANGVPTALVPTATSPSPAQYSLAGAIAGQPVTATYYAAMVPEDVQLAILLLAAHFYRNRESASDVMMKDIPSGYADLFADYICYAGAFEL